MTEHRNPPMPAPQMHKLLDNLERRYVRSLNAILAGTAAPGLDNDADVNRWRGHAEAYRQVCELIRKSTGLEPAAYTSQEWRTANGVYTAADIAKFRPRAGEDLDED